MGQEGSSVKSGRTNSKSVEAPMIEPPTACVIGAGLTGVSVAKELADRGFKVTVLERNKHVGRGATMFDSGVVGAAGIQPTGYDTEWAKDFFLGFLPFNRRPLISHETFPLYNLPDSWEKVSFYFHRSRLLAWNGLERGTVLQATRQLAIKNEAKVLSLLEEIPELQNAVFPGSTFSLLKPGHWRATNLLRREKQGGGGGEEEEPTIGDQLVIDPTRWTEIVAQYLQEKKGVEFKLETHATTLVNRLSFGVEFVGNVEHISRDPETGSETKPRREMYDVYCICTGARTRDLMQGRPYPLPVLPITSFGLLFDAGRNEAWKALIPSHPKAAYAQLMDSGAIQAHRASLTLNSLLPPSSKQEEENAVAPTSWWLVTGLTSLYNYQIKRKDPRNSKSYISELFSERLSIYRGFHDLPVISDTSQSAHVFRYSKDATPDGLPVISRVGRFRNLFACTGMGDNASRFSFGSAAMLGEILDNTGRTRSNGSQRKSSDGTTPAPLVADTLEGNPFSYSRFNSEVAKETTERGSSMVPAAVDPVLLDAEKISEVSPSGRSVMDREGRSPVGTTAERFGKGLIWSPPEAVKNMFPSRFRDAGAAGDYGALGEKSFSTLDGSPPLGGESKAQ